MEEEFAERERSDRFRRNGYLNFPHPPPLSGETMRSARYELFETTNLLRFTLFLRPFRHFWATVLVVASITVRETKA
jgi:hypothetical protein